MEPGVNLLEPAQLDSRVNLGRRDGGMAQHLLNGPKIGPSGKEVSREAVPERVRTDRIGQSGRAGCFFHDRPEPDARDWSA